jgi:hypothetical protein
VEESFGYIIKVVYFVPLVCDERSVSWFSKTNGCGHDRVVEVGFTVGANMKGKPIVIKALLNASANVSNRFST